jgi:hypothetical protein
MAGVEAPWLAMGVLLGEGREEKEEGEGVGQLGGSPWGLLGGGVLLQGGAGLLLCTWFPTVREEGNRKKEKRRDKKKRRKKGEKRKEIFFKLGNF